MRESARRRRERTDITAGGGDENRQGAGRGGESRNEEGKWSSWENTGREEGGI